MPDRYDIILCGKITGDPDYKLKFAKAKNRVRMRFPNARIWNPAELPNDLDYAFYLKTCFDVIAADRNAPATAVFLNDWSDSRGARLERAAADAFGLAILDQWWEL